jgi:hypothetical protein
VPRMPKCKSCGKKVAWLQMVRNPLLLRNWKVLDSLLVETLCLECVASWNTSFDWYKKYQASRKGEQVR